MAVNNLICLPRFHRNYEVYAGELNESERKLSTVHYANEKSD